MYKPWNPEYSYSEYEKVMKENIFNDDCKLKNVVLGPSIFMECPNFIEIMSIIE